MPELTKEEKLKLIEKLPQQLQEFLYSEDTGAFLLYLGNKHKLPDEKISALSKIVADIILKITPITNLAQEIVNKITPDQHMAMAIAQELNSELLAPVLMPAPTAPMTPTPAPIVPAMPSPAPAPMPTPVMPPAPKPVLPAAPTIKTDQYRETTAGGPAPQLPGPEIVDLRNQPKAGPPLAETPPLTQMPVAAAPAYIPEEIMVNKVESPRPLTFTKPIEKLIEPPKSIPAPIPLIEAEPHKIVDLPRPPVVSPSTPLRTSAVEPQFIIRPPGLAPTDLPHDILDLRKDKGEF